MSRRLVLTPPPDYRALAANYARHAGISVPMFLAQIGQESGFNPNARSGAGAVGIAQIVPRWHPGVNATDPNASLKYAANWMAQLIKQYGSPAAALSVYNSGNPHAYKNPNFAGGQTYNYVKNILARAGTGAVSPPQTAGPPRQPRSLTQALPKVQPGKPTNLMPLLKILGLSDIPGIDQLATLAAPQQRPLQASVTSRQLPGRQITPKIQVQGKITANDVAAVQLAKKFIGTPYSWGGGGTQGPSKGFGRGANTVGFDCSSLIQYVWAKQGVSLPRVTYDQIHVGQPVARNQLRPGDAVFFHAGQSGPEHVGMFIGNGKFIEAPHTGATVRISTLAGRSDFVAARRYG